MAPLVSTYLEVIDELDLHLAKKNRDDPSAFCRVKWFWKDNVSKEVARVGCTNYSSLMKPEVKIWKRAKCIPQLEASTHCLQSKFELVEFTEDGCSTPTSKILMQACPEPIRRREEKGNIIIYIEQIIHDHSIYPSTTSMGTSPTRFSLMWLRYDCITYPKNYHSMRSIIGRMSQYTLFCIGPDYVVQVV